MVRTVIRLFSWVKRAVDETRRSVAEGSSEIPGINIGAFRFSVGVFCF